MKRVFVFVLTVFLVTGTIFAGASKEQSGGVYDPSKVKIAFCNAYLNNPTVRIFELGFLKACQELGYTDAKIIGTEGTDPSEVFSAAEAFAAEGGKALIFPWNDSTGNATIARISAQGVLVGIPHFNHVRSDGTYPEGIRFSLACEPQKYGSEAAVAMAKKLSGKTGSIAITQSTRNITENAASDSFIKTWETLGPQYNVSGIKILPVQLEGAGSLDQATAVDLAIIQANRDIVGAFGTTGQSALSWADAATKSGRKDGEICIIGMDATEGNLDYLEAGKVYALVAQPIYEEHYEAVVLMDKLLRGEAVPEWTTLEAPIVTKEGSGKNGPAYHRDIAAEVKKFFK